MAEEQSVKNELAELEKEIASIKATVRLLGSSDGVGADRTDSNSLSVVLLKVEGLPEGAKPSLKLELSSPVEEATITEIFDPLVQDVPETMKATFRGVETGLATLTVTAKDVDIPLGSSSPLDLSLLTNFDAMTSKKEYESESTLDIRAESKSEGESVCNVTIRITYEPSSAEKREQLYDKLSDATKKKSTMVEKLRQAAHANRQMTTRAPSSSPAVKAGFLNKTSRKEENEQPGLFQIWSDRFQRYFGPQSFLRKAKNYFIFAGIVGFFHFKGHVLALPPPV